MQLRALPKFKFILDDSIAYSVHISELIESLHIGECKEEAEPGEE